MQNIFSSFCIKVVRVPQRSMIQAQRRFLQCPSCLAYNSQREEQSDKMEKLNTNPYFDKYADKIASLQRISPDEFLSRIGAFERQKSKSKMPLADERGFSSIAPSGKLKPSTKLSFTKEQKLDTIMKFDLIKDKSGEEIAKIWGEYHQSQDKIAAVIPAKIYSTIFENSQEFPVFLYPLPREQGYEFFVAQFSGHECHFTSLINYQDSVSNRFMDDIAKIYLAHKENAPECLAIVHYTELQDENGIVLMRGEYNKDILSGNDARCLTNQLQLYYTAPSDGQKRNLLITFNKNPNNFKHMELIDQLNNFII